MSMDARVGMTAIIIQGGHASTPLKLFLLLLL